jgi:hypothetical protein
MQGNLGSASAIGALSAQNRIVAGAWMITFVPTLLPQQESYEVWHAAALGPGGYFRVYIDDKLYGIGQNGSINEYTPSIPMFVVRGQIITMHWSIATGAAPQAWLYFRRPEVGRI